MPSDQAVGRCGSALRAAPCRASQRTGGRNRPSRNTCSNAQSLAEASSLPVFCRAPTQFSTPNMEMRQSPGTSRAGRPEPTETQRDYQRRYCCKQPLLDCHEFGPPSLTYQGIILPHQSHACHHARIEPGPDRRRKTCRHSRTATNVWRSFIDPYRGRPAGPGPAGPAVLTIGQPILVAGAVIGHGNRQEATTALLLPAGLSPAALSPNSLAHSAADKNSTSTNR